MIFKSGNKEDGRWKRGGQWAALGNFIKTRSENERIVKSRNEFSTLNCFLTVLLWRKQC